MSKDDVKAMVGKTVTLYLRGPHVYEGRFTATDDGEGITLTTSKVVFRTWRNEVIAYSYQA
jgi:small nuclear ribonucleoprotein (snRNP)-like protein